MKNKGVVELWRWMRKLVGRVIIGVGILKISSRDQRFIFSIRNKKCRKFKRIMRNSYRKCSRRRDSI